MPPFSKLRSTLARVYREVGLLPLVLVPYLTLAVVMHRMFAPGRGYTWLHPMIILYTVVTSRHFPLAAALVLLLGQMDQVKRDDFRRLLSNLGRQQRIAPYARSIALASTTAVVLMAAAALNEQYELTDFLAIGALGAFVGGRRLGWPVYRRFCSQLLFIFIVFTVVSYSFTVVKAMLFHFRAPHDAEIVRLEHAIFGVVPHRLIAGWASTRPWVVLMSDTVYYALFHHMILISLFLIGAKKIAERIELISALVLCYVLGGLTYYLWPGLGPGYFDPGTYRFLGGLPLATNAFRKLLFHNTYAITAGLPGKLQTYEYVACMPSLHMGHEFVMLYYARSNIVAFGLSLLFTSFTLCAVVILGWHYPIDAVFGAMLSATAIAVVRWQRTRLFPAWLAR